MNTFNKKSLYAALAGLSALGVTGAAQAVSVNQDGLGMALIYPYYTVRTNAAGHSYQSLISVVNTTPSARVVKVRFLEGKNSREVLDFNLFLSKRDVWVAGIIPTADGAGIFTPDKSCTVPVVSNNPAAPTPFVNYAYTGSNADGGDTSLDRTREGYAEVIAMAQFFSRTATYTTVTHALGSTPGTPDCDPAIIQSPNISTPAPQVASDVSDYLIGGLFGGITLINVGDGIDVAVEATALDAWSTNNQLFAEGSIQPNLAQVTPKTSVVTAGQYTFVTDWSAPTQNAVDAVSAVLMHDYVYNEFILDAATQSQTDWVITFPTKWAYYSGKITDSTGATVGVAVTKLFQRNFLGTKGACDDVVINRYDREERTVASTTTFSPPPPTATDSICWEANVLTFNNSALLASKNSYNIPTTFENGWVSLRFPTPTTAVPRYHQLYGGFSTIFNIYGNSGSSSTTTFSGLPVIGFATSSFKNGNIAAGSTVYYSGRQNHRFERNINGFSTVPPILPGN